MTAGEQLASEGSQEAALGLPQSPSKVYFPCQSQSKAQLSLIPQTARKVRWDQSPGKARAEGGHRGAGQGLSTAPSQPLSPLSVLPDLLGRFSIRLSQDLLNKGSSHLSRLHL
jgi:hypothetical protein